MTSLLMNLLDGGRRRLTLHARSSATRLFTWKERRSAKARWNKELQKEGKKSKEEDIGGKGREMRKYREGFGERAWPPTITIIPRVLFLLLIRRRFYLSLSSVCKSRLTAVSQRTARQARINEWKKLQSPYVAAATTRECERRIRESNQAKRWVDKIAAHQG